MKLQPATVQQPLAQYNLPGMGGGFNSSNLNLYGYAMQNPMKITDPDGRSGEAAAINFGRALFAAGAGASATGVFAEAGLPMMAIGATLMLSGDTRTQSKAEPISISQTSAKKDDSTVIYRWGNGTNTNLTPREQDKTGLSFSTTKPASGKYTETTIGAVNSTGSLMAIKDGPSHVSVMPANPTDMQSWIDSRPTAEVSPHPLTSTLKAIVE